mgnify:CR=1 FL=1
MVFSTPVFMFYFLALTLLLTACGTAPAAPESKRTITDQAGFEVELPEKIERIVVCDILPLPSVLAVFFDSAEKIVGMSGTSMSAAANGLLGELYPEILDAETGFIDGSTVNVEELMKLQPDVVFYNASRRELGEQLRNAGFPAVAISVNKWEYDSIETLNQWIALLSEIFPENAKTEVVESYSRQVYDLVQSRVADIPERERVLFLYQYSETNMLTSGAKFFGQWWADAIGAVNVAGVRHLATALKDIAGVLGLETELDRQEKEARIAALRAKAAAQDADGAQEITVTFDAGPEEWNE